MARGQVGAGRDKGDDMRRMAVILAAVTAFAVPASVAAVALGAGPAGASSSTTCTKLKGSVSGNTVTISKCNDLAPKPPKNTLKPDKNNKEITGEPSLLEPGASGTLAWQPSGVTFVNHTLTATTNGTQGSCKKSTDLEYTATGDIVSSNSPYVHAGDHWSVNVCVTSKFKLYFPTGASWTF